MTLRLLLTAMIISASLLSNNAMAESHGHAFLVNQSADSHLNHDADHDELRIFAEDSAEELREVQRIRYQRSADCRFCN